MSLHKEVKSMLDAFTVFALISGTCSIISLVLQILPIVRAAWKKAKPSAATDGFDTGSESQDEEPYLQ